MIFLNLVSGFRFENKGCTKIERNQNKRSYYFYLDGGGGYRNEQSAFNGIFFEKWNLKMRKCICLIKTPVSFDILYVQEVVTHFI